MVSNWNRIDILSCSKKMIPKLPLGPYHARDKKIANAAADVQPGSKVRIWKLSKYSIIQAQKII